jgi:hypothetical protein
MALATNYKSGCVGKKYEGGVTFKYFGTVVTIDTTLCVLKKHSIFPIQCIYLVFRTNFTCTKYFLLTLSILQHVSAHHMCHRQGVFVVFITTLSNGPLCDK